MQDSNRYHKRPVKCLENGRIFESMYDASKFCGGNIKQNQSNIWKCCHKTVVMSRGVPYVRKTVKGYHFEFWKGNNKMAMYKVEEESEFVNTKIFKTYPEALKWVTDFLEIRNDKSYSFRIIEVMKDETDVCNV